MTTATRKAWEAERPDRQLAFRHGREIAMVRERLAQRERAVQLAKARRVSRHGIPLLDKEEAPASVRSNLKTRIGRLDQKSSHQWRNDDSDTDIPWDTGRGTHPISVIGASVRRERINAVPGLSSKSNRCSRTEERQ
jgi:hypothetical protein